MTNTALRNKCENLSSRSGDHDVRVARNRQPHTVHHWCANAVATGWKGRRNQGRVCEGVNFHLNHGVHIPWVGSCAPGRMVVISSEEEYGFKHVPPTEASWRATRFGPQDDHRRRGCANVRLVHDTSAFGFANSGGHSNVEHTAPPEASCLAKGRTESLGLWQVRVAVGDQPDRVNVQKHMIS